MKVSPAELLAEIHAALEKYNTDPQLTTRQKLRVYDGENIIIVEQNPNKDSFFGIRHRAANDVAQILYKDREKGKGVYIGVNIGDNVYLYYATLRKIFGIDPDTLIELVNSHRYYTTETKYGRYIAQGYIDSNTEKPIMVRIKNVQTRQISIIFHEDIVKEYMGHK